MLEGMTANEFEELWAAQQIDPDLEVRIDELQTSICHVLCQLKGVKIDRSDLHPNWTEEPKTMAEQGASLKAKAMAMPSWTKGK